MITVEKMVTPTPYLALGLRTYSLEGTMGVWSWGNRQSWEGLVSARPLFLQRPCARRGETRAFWLGFVAQRLCCCLRASSGCGGQGLLIAGCFLLQSTGSVAVPCGPSCSTASGVFLDQGSNPCLLHCQVDPHPLCHKGSPRPGFRSLKIPFCPVGRSRDEGQGHIGAAV